MPLYKRILSIAMALAFFAMPWAMALDGEIHELYAEIDLAEFDEEAFNEIGETIAGDVPDIKAPSAILIESETGDVIYEKDADSRREPASITKIMTQLLVVEALGEGLISLEDEVITSAHAASMGGSQIYLKEGEKMTVHELMKAVAVNSANDGAVALAEHVAGSEQSFVSMMNKRAAELGMENTNFTNSSGVIPSKENYTTARDVAIMSRELMKHELILNYSTIWMDSLRDGATALVNTNRLVRFYDGTTGLKTGFTSAAGYCLAAAAKREGVEFISVTLGDKNSTDRFEGAKTLLNYAFAVYTLVPALDSVLPPLRVELGKTAYIQPLLKGNDKLLLTKSEANDIQRELNISKEVKAPVAAGQEVGRLTIKVGERVVADIPIVADEASDRLGWGDIFLRLLSMVFTPRANK